MAQYRARQGEEDRYGEMTGAISVNMVLAIPPTGIWCVFIGPAMFDSAWPVALTGVALGAALTLACRPLSRRIWARISDAMGN